MRWVMAWLENGFGCSMKDERTCTMRREVGVHRWFKQTISRKNMCTVFWDRQGVLLVEVLPQGTTINSAVYCETLKKLRHAIQNKRRGMLSATILLLHDNARPHSAAQTQDLITSSRWKQMNHPPVQPWFGAKWFSPLLTPKDVPGRQAIWRPQWPERCSAVVANIAGGRILWGEYTKTCAPLRWVPQ